MKETGGYIGQKKRKKNCFRNHTTQKKRALEEKIVLITGCLNMYMKTNIKILIWKILKFLRLCVKRVKLKLTLFGLLVSLKKGKFW